ncbi:hypothetical protein KP509_13G089100 [Ceratopteris richardii]|uniref:Uncharacterized protein n=1 Tax=Ceratopteris richardii TaxID=49495 RepID=A0A8T2TNA7_CERRI|nr:hypothetical protein KP509_13G089100 [Ceratopteris richardii]
MLLFVMISDGVARLVRDDDDNDGYSGFCYTQCTQKVIPCRSKVLIFRPTGETVRSCAELLQRLEALGWRRLAPSGAQPSTLLLEKATSSSASLLMLPSDIRYLTLPQMLDIVIKNQQFFFVRDAS